MVLKSKLNIGNLTITKEGKVHCTTSKFEEDVKRLSEGKVMRPLNSELSSCTLILLHLSTCTQHGEIVKQGIDRVVHNTKLVPILATRRQFNVLRSLVRGRGVLKSNDRYMQLGLCSLGKLLSLTEV